MEGKKNYQSGYVVGGGKIHIHTADKGDKFKILNMSAEKIEIMTIANANVSDIVTLKVQIKSDLCMVNIKSIGKIIDKAIFNNEIEYTIEFVGMSDSDKEEIDQLIIDSFDLVS
jgi:c-di-GMP-binding flagellar brake protein YcgR